MDRPCQEANAAYQRGKSGRAQDSEKSAPIVTLPGGQVRMPAEPKGDVDARAELLANMALVKKAMEAIAEADPLKIVQLSKRHSELVEELVRVSAPRPPAGGGDESEGGDPFSGIFGGAAGRSAAPPRVKA